MRLFFDKRLNYFVAAPGQSAAATGAVVKSGDTERVEILVGRSSDPAGAPGLFEAQEWTNEAFPTGTNIAIVAKAPGKYSDGLPLALADDFTLSGNTYTFELDLNTDEINDELNRGDDEEENDIASITAGFEMSYQLGGSGGWQSSALPFALTINHDLYSGVEGNPNSASSPDAYLLRSNGVRHFKDLDALVGGDPTDLDSIPTVSAPLGELYSLVDESGTDPVYRVYRLEAGTDATDAPDVVRPDDYATTTNEKVFRLVLAEFLASLSNPMTTAGDIIKGGTSGVPERLAVGTTGQVLTVVEGSPEWDDAPSLTVLDDNLDTNGFYVDFDNNRGIRDDAGNNHLLFEKTTSAVNYLTVKHQSTTNNPAIIAKGSDTNIGINLVPKGTGAIQADGSRVLTVAYARVPTYNHNSVPTPVNGLMAHINDSASDTYNTQPFNGAMAMVSDGIWRYVGTGDKVNSA